MPRKPKKETGPELSVLETGCLLIILVGVGVATGSVVIATLVGIGYGIALSY